MNKVAVAKELVKIAKSLTADSMTTEFSDIRDRLTDVIIDLQDTAD
jgi:hypothetical protein